MSGSCPGFQWCEKRSAAALLLAEGHTQEQVASALSISDRTIRRWLADTAFKTEVDRLSVMIGIASCAARMRIVHKAVREKMKDGVVESDKDILDWLKYAQSETSGIRLALTSDLLEQLAVAK